MKAHSLPVSGELPNAHRVNKPALPDDGGDPGGSPKRAEIVLASPVGRRTLKACYLPGSGTQLCAASLPHHLHLLNEWGLGDDNYIQGRGWLRRGGGGSGMIKGKNKHSERLS